MDRSHFGGRTARGRRKFALATVRGALLHPRGAAPQPVRSFRRDGRASNVVGHGRVAVPVIQLEPEVSGPHGGRPRPAALESIAGYDQRRPRYIGRLARIAATLHSTRRTIAVERIARDHASRDSAARNSEEWWVIESGLCGTLQLHFGLRDSRAIRPYPRILRTCSRPTWFCKEAVCNPMRG